MKSFPNHIRLVVSLALLALLVVGCSDSSVGVPGGPDLNSPEEQKKVQEHYKEMADSGHGPGGGESGPVGTPPGGDPKGAPGGAPGAPL